MGDTLSTILILIAVSVVVAALRARRKDRCLKWFDGQKVTLHGLEPQSVSGRLEVESNAFIVTYSDPARPKANEIFYTPEWVSMAWLECRLSDMNPRQSRRRARRLRRAVRPSLWVRLGRDVRILLNSAKDTVLDILTALMAATRKATPLQRFGEDAPVLDRIKQAGGQSLTAYAHEPVWERYRGHAVVIEALGESGLSFQGTLVEYSQSYILLFDAGEPGRDVLVRRELATVRHILRAPSAPL